MSAIQVVGTQAYLAGLGVVHESDDCLTHLAQVHHPACGSCVCYLKYYLENREPPNKGLVNEVCGYILAESSGLGVPDNPLIIMLPAERVADMHRTYSRRLPHNAVLALWATEQIRGQTLPPNMGQAASWLRRWKGLPALIAFDTWVVNADRSAGNLIRRRNGEMVLIDHGHLAGGVRWTRDLLQMDADPWHHFLGIWGNEIPESINQGIMAAASQHSKSYQQAEAELQKWASTLLGDSGDTIALLDFLKKRANESQDRMRRVLRLLV